MRIDDLIRYGFPRRIIECWRNDGLEYLLPLQMEAIKSFGLLKDESLLISGPTSSGKTLCGELAAVRAAANNRKALFLTPMKALASEKYHKFKKRYRRAGFKIIIVSSDYPENRRRFIKGDYDLAIVVYEIFDSLTAANLACLEIAGTVILDEFQLVATSDRGQAYESAISKIRHHSSKIQIIGLIGGLNECELFSKWLGIPLLKSTSRPVELHRGILFNGKFSFKRCNDCHEGTEYFTSANEDNNIIPDGASITPELYHGIKYLTDKNEQVLIFVSTRNACQRLAEGLADMLRLPPAESIIERFDDMPDTCQKNILMECLKNGVCFHNADLSLPYRRLLEDGFQSGEIRAIVSTSTLALGVNLPSRNVFIEAVKYYDGFNGEAVLKPLMMYDYNQISGRAGRLGLEKDFGRAIIIADDETRKELLWDSYIYGMSAPVVEPFDTEKLASLLLKWISCGLVKDDNDTKYYLSNCLRGYRESFGSLAVNAVYELLNKYNFIKYKGCRLCCTNLGRVAAGYNIDLNSAALIHEQFSKYSYEDNLLSWLFFFTTIPRMYKLQRTVGASFQCAVGSPNPTAYCDIINKTLADYDETPVGLLAKYLENPDSSISPGMIQTFLLLTEIIAPAPTIEIEMKYNAGWGRIKNIGEQYANIMRATADIGEGCGLIQNKKKNLLNYAECLYHGLPSESLIFARLKISLLERDFILRLNNAGIAVPSDVVNSGFDIISTLLPYRVADSLFKRCSKMMPANDKPDDITAATEKQPLAVKKNGSRYELTINGSMVSLQPRLYSYFHKLYNADNPEGWLDKNFLDAGVNQVKYIYKLKKALKGITGIVIEGDGGGRYRLMMEKISRLEKV
ncbi:MAG: DEAD/DEAH box helicase [candidate division Zixibacteria bacterium]|nr:DEAD/DEAH box helicase [candidate division Zixibacteria bacterium]